MDHNVQFVGKIDRKIYKCVNDDIVTDEVVITPRRVRHIQKRHPNDYERYFQYAAQIIENPDYILESGNPNIAFILKHIRDEGNYQLILWLRTSKDPSEFKNSVVTFLKVNKKRYRRYLKTKKILYKSK
ncbi:MAG: PBECR2 nuclease fold domain-containing protein [Bacteroides sp.]|nr:PBECR2 nuclease fold domain-containing protein [Eubacterium sp.]MCM1462913.1 PBECR2 nuclease fold domain-containing protein [Bacteroides sp.]